MKLIVLHHNADLSAGGSASGGLRIALSGEPLAGVVLDALSRSASQIGISLPSRGQAVAVSPVSPVRDALRRDALRGGLSGLRVFARRSLCRNARTIWAIPQSWDVNPPTTLSPRIISYAGEVSFSCEMLRRAKRDGWLVVSNGRFVTQVNKVLLKDILAGTEADVVAVNAEPALLAASEKVRLTVYGKIAGFRRLYEDSAELASIPAEWPHHLLIAGRIIERLLDDGALPRSFSDVLERCRSNSLECRAIKVAGSALDLETEEGLLGLCRAAVFPAPSNSYTPILNGVHNGDIDHDRTLQREPRFVGKVLFGRNVHIEPDVVIAGPCIIGRGARIQRRAVISSSIIGPDVCVAQGRFVRNSVLMAAERRMEGQVVLGNSNSRRICSGPEFDGRRFAGEVFRRWPAFPYARCFKRILDIIFALFVLALFAPIMPFVALAIKLTSPGPVFYKDKRQGRHGKTFNCLKFRTMRTGSDTMQEKLRAASQVDGPQFKIDNDPRITTVGMFLRNTFIDEIPQFFNVLFGQMSVVGPRPSPESENTLCPSWRDARLSVRPGITGLWQVHRTRKPGRDFQEWIHYDTKYVRNLSLGMDLRVCLLTIKKMVNSFIRQF
ncbi:MAG TPA: sugar transferase [Sedimentisphaerales bacterium]|nr:sugar transferase [Sedimentisphaerales bacterium]